MQSVLSDYQDQLLRGVVHRMNNILSIFHGYVGLLMEDKKLDAATRDGLNRIKLGADAASELIDRTGALVRPISPNWREISLSDLLRQMRPTLERLCSPGIKIEIEAAPADLPAVWADASRVRMGLTELVKNACEAAKSKVTIQLVATSGRVQDAHFEANLATPEPWVGIRVTDDGGGIPAEHAEEVYQPFYSTKKKQLGAGLGLTVAMGCAQHLGGSLEHRSRPGETTFEFALPTRAANGVAAPLQIVA